MLFYRAGSGDCTISPFAILLMLHKFFQNPVAGDGNTPNSLASGRAGRKKKIEGGANDRIFFEQPFATPLDACFESGRNLVYPLIIHGKRMLPESQGQLPFLPAR